MNQRHFLAAQNREEQCRRDDTSALTQLVLAPLQSSDFPEHIVLFQGYLIIFTWQVPGAITSMLQPRSSLSWDCLIHFSHSFSQSESTTEMETSCLPANSSSTARPHCCLAQSHWDCWQKILLKATASKDFYSLSCFCFPLLIKEKPKQKHTYTKKKKNPL